jgi:RNA polymerase primary sigma factor
MINDGLPSDIYGTPVARLLELGRQKSYVTLADVLFFFPDAKQDTDKLEDVFAALLSAGIPCQDGDTWLTSGGGEVAVEAGESLESSEEDELTDIDVDNGFGLYLKDVGWIPLLTRNEEVELATRIERGHLAQDELASEGMAPGRQDELHNLIKDGRSAREHLVVANARLVISVAKKYVNRGVAFQDLVQEGNIGLMRAIKKYDYRLGFKFGTYATWWIRQAVTRAIADQGRTIRVPTHMHDLISKVLRVQYQLTQRLGRFPELGELAEVLNISPEKVEEIIQVSIQPLSLESPANHEGDMLLGDFIEDEEASTPVDLVTYNQLQEHLEEVFKSFPPRDVYILKLRYGLVDGEKHTLEEIGSMLGVTRERVRQIEAKALQRLRHPSISSELRTYLGSE